MRMTGEVYALPASYRGLLESGDLERRAAVARAWLSDCTVCPRSCHVNRAAGEHGYCRAGVDVRVASYGPHFGEEEPLVGSRGSGTVFFSWCNLRCVFCQNYDVSRGYAGSDVTVQELARIMGELQAMGCHNINLVSPSHYVPQIIEAVLIAAREGLNLPLVYNTGGYDSVDTLRLLDGIVDIYMPDLKYLDTEKAARYSDASDYPQVARAAIKEMHAQVGDLVCDGRGVAVRGMIVRHLVLPGELGQTEKVIRWVAAELSPTTYLNVMGQYHPAYQASRYPELARRLARDEYVRALELVREIEPRLRS